MDEKLNALWEQGSYPFDQPIFDLDDLIEINQLQRCLSDIGSYLKKNYTDEVIFINNDWHEHDGYISNSEVIDWDDYLVNFSDTMTLYKSRDGDTFVRITIYPESTEFVLRYYIPGEDEDTEYPGSWGTFDLTIDQKHMSNIQRILDTIGIKYTLWDSKLKFDRVYGGRNWLSSQ